MTNPLHNFVSLPLCTRLLEYGLTSDTWASYREYVSGDWCQAYLVAPGLDFDNVYANRPLAEGELPPVCCDTPAYTLLDMLKCIPLFQLGQQDVSLVRISTGLGVLGQNGRPIQSEPGESMPDTIARFVIRLLDEGRYTADDFNKELLTNPLIIAKD